MAKTAFGRLIQDARIKKRLTQKQLGQILGHGSGMYVSRIERGVIKFPRKQVARIAQALEIPKLELMLAAFDDTSLLTAPGGDRGEG